MTSIKEDAHAMLAELTELRDALHREPELGLQLPLTQGKVLAALGDLPLEISLGQRTTSITAVLRGGAARSGQAPVVLLRADMDALPLLEQSDDANVSQIPNAMHACGHDLHTAMLVGAARLLAARQDELAGDIVFMFQPGEEVFQGAEIMIEEGVLDAAGRRADAAYGMHVFSGRGRSGDFELKPGVMMAASDELRVTVHGTGGHGASPHLAHDPVPAMAEMITALQVLVTRQFDVFDPAIITVGLVQAGTKANIIPDTAFFSATVRTFSETARKRMQEGTVALIDSIASAHGLRAETDYFIGYPTTVNNDDEAKFVEQTIVDLVGEDRLCSLPNPLTASEDFSRILHKVPGAFIFLSAATNDTDAAAAAFNHSPLARFDSAVMPDGAALLATLAMNRLSQLSSP